MIEFYIRDVDFSLFKQFEPVQWTQALSDLSSWSEWPKEKAIKLRMEIDAVEFVPTSPERHAKHNIKRVKPIVIDNSLLVRHKLKTRASV
jgi:hypothetical protein